MLQTGQLLQNRYELQHQLGQDASRQTWLAQDLHGDRHQPVVLKLLALSPEMQWDECKLFEREAAILQRLSHPRIPRYHDYFVLDRHPGSRFPWFVLVQDYIPGKSLQQWLEEGYRFSEAQIQQIAVEVLQILIYLHDFNPPVLHRDIKPSNLIWDEQQQIYLVDFGAVQDQAALEGATFTVVGTYGYVPMEQFGGRAVPASDLYALGATLIHLLTGVAPADLPHQDGRIQFGESVSLDLGLIYWIGKLTEPDWINRLGSARDALTALNDRATLSPPITNPKPLGSQIQLQKSATQLNIELPRRGTKAYRAFFLIGLWIPLLIYLPHYYHLLAGNSNLRWLLLITLFVGIPILSLVQPVFAQTRLLFDRDEFEIQRILFGFCYWRHQGKTGSITQIYEQTDKVGGAAKGITIQLWDRKLTTNPLSTVERQWLIQELEDWLGLARWQKLNRDQK
jgi:serine/threonine protein kinase